MIKKGKVLFSKTKFKGRWVEIDEDYIKKPNNTKAIHEIAKRRNCVLILAFENGKLLLIRQYRYPANEMLWEFPTGFINDKESPLHAAKRELEEESGLVARKMNLLGSFWTWPGFSTQKTYVFLASEFTEGRKSPDGSESDLKSKFIFYKTVLEFIKNGVIKSSTTLAALVIFTLKRKIPVS